MFKPLLAATCEDMAALKFPLLASPKLDGIRAMVIDGKLVSRTMKAIPNDYVRSLFSNPALNGMDGELIDGNPTDADAFNRTTRSVMRGVGMPTGVRFHVFDNMVVPTASFVMRLAHAKTLCGAAPVLAYVEHTMVSTLDEVIRYEAKMVAAGYEGIMLRAPHGSYKMGRSTMREQTLMKVKRFTDDEAVVIDVVEGEHNGNVATKDAFGRTERSSHKAGMVPTGIMGKLVVRNGAGQEFGIGTGFTAADRVAIWNDHKRGVVLGRSAKYRYQAAGMKDVPRFPSFVGFRED